MVKKLKGSIKAVIFGDYMLDKYTKGIVNRISPEAPVSIFQVEENSFQPGGAGNVALNLLSLRANVEVVGRIGEDEEGLELLKSLKQEGANVENLVIQKNYPTIVKNRLIASSQQVIRIDSEKICPISKDLEKFLLKNLFSIIKDKDVVAISDYGKGFLSKKLISEIIKICNDLKIPSIVDPKGYDFSKYRGATIIKPNLKEAYLAANLSFKEPLEKVAVRILEETLVKNLLITRSEEGITLFYKDFKREDFSVKSKEVKDVTGAGDTVLATLALCVASGFDIKSSLKLSNIAAGISIEQVGCGRVSFKDLEGRLLEESAFS